MNVIGLMIDHLDRHQLYVDLNAQGFQLIFCPGSKHYDHDNLHLDGDSGIRRHAVKDSSPGAKGSLVGSRDYS